MYTLFKKERFLSLMAGDNCNCIPLCSCVCFELSFNASESLKLLIPPCGALHLVKTSLILVNFASKDLFVTSTSTLVRKIML